MILAQAEFAYNNFVNRSTRKTPFEIITRMQPGGISDLKDIVGEEKCWRGSICWFYEALAWGSEIEVGTKKSKV